MRYLFRILILSLLPWTAMTQCEETEVLTTGADSIVFVCPGDGRPDPIGFSSNATDQSSNYDFILTDGNDEIITLLPIPIIDFDGFFEGECRIYGVSYDGNLDAPAGGQITEISTDGSCAVLSGNYVTVIKEIPAAGTLIDQSGNDLLEICASNQEPDSIRLRQIPDAIGTSAYILLREDSIIADIWTSDLIDGDSLAAGSFEIRAIAYSGELLLDRGDTIDVELDTLSDDCYSLSPNGIRLVVEAFSTGTISDDLGRTEIFACADNGNPDVFYFISDDSTATNISYVLTDTSKEVLMILDGDSIDLEGMGVGIAQIWAVIYDGELLLSPGDTLSSANAVATGCADISDQPIDVVKDIPVTPVMRDHLGQEISRACPGDGRDDIVGFQSIVDPKGFLQIIITTPDGLIIGLPRGDEANFENVGPGECHVWGLSYTGELNLQIGTFLDIDGILSTDCFELSENFVRVIRLRLDGGEVFTAVDSSRSFFTCPQDGISDLLVMDSDYDSDSEYSYILTDTFGVLVAVIDENQIDLDSFGPGICLAYGLSHIGDILAEPGDTIVSDDALIDNIATVCSQLSDNHVLIEKAAVDGGVLSSSLGEAFAYLCTEEGSLPFVLFESDTESDQSYQLVLVNENDIIVNLPDNNVVDFRNFTANDCRVYGLSYSGELSVNLGDPWEPEGLFSSGCYDLSDNFVQILKDEPEGGNVMFADSTEIFNACGGDGRPDIAHFITDSESSLRYSYLLADNNLKFLNVITADSVDFEIFPPGQCLIVGASYSGNFIMSLGDDVFTDAISDDCYDISDNFIVVSREGFEPHILTTVAGDSSAFVCPGIPGDAQLSFAIDNPNGQEVLLLLDDNDEVLEISEDGNITLDPQEPGICYARSLYFSGSLRVEVGDIIRDTSTLSSRCFALSSNRLPIYKEAPSIDRITSTLGTDTVSVCPGDGIPNFVKLIAVDEVRSDLGTIITTPEGLILNISSRDSFDLDAFPLGNCMLWGIAFTGNLTPVVGQFIDDVTEFTDDCWALSSNALFVIKEQPEGGLILGRDGVQSYEICIDDGIEDYILTERFDQVGTQYAYLYTTEENVVTTITFTDSIDLDNSTAGECRLYGLSYTGSLQVSIGSDLDDALPLSTDCHELSNNFIEIRKSRSQAGEVTISQADNIWYSCTSEAVDSVEISVTSAIGEEQIFVVTDEMNTIVALIPTADLSGWEDLGLGRYTVFHLSFSGTLAINTGDMWDPAGALSDLCYSLADDSITLIRDEPMAGELSFAGRTDSATICGIDSSIMLEITGASDLAYAFAIVNASGRVLDISLGNGTIDLSNIDQRIVGIVGISYSGQLILRPGANILEADISTGCHTFASNRFWLEINRPFVSDVNSALGDSLLLCSKDQFLDSLQLTIDYESQLELALIVVDASGEIVLVDRNQEILDLTRLPDGNLFLVYAVSHAGQLLVDVGDIVGTDPDLFSSCAAISQRPLYIEISDIEGGIINTTDGETSIEICVGDGEEDILRFQERDASAPHYSFVVTNEDNIITNFSFGGSFLFDDQAPGVCRVFGIAHDAEIINVSIGTALADNDFSEECFALSNNFVTVTKVTDGPLCIVSTEDLDETRWQIYPNPAMNYIQIESPGAEEAKYFLHDLQGRLLSTGEMTTRRSRLDIEDFTPGMMLLQIVTDDGAFAKMILKH